MATVLASEVLDTALALGRLSIDAGDAALASFALFKGALVWPTEEELAKLQLSAAAMDPGPSAIARTWDAVKRRFAAHGEPVPDGVVERRRELAESE